MDCTMLPHRSAGHHKTRLRYHCAVVTCRPSRQPHWRFQAPLARIMIGWEGSAVHGGLTRLAPERYDDEIRQRISDISGVAFHDYLAALNAAVQQRDDLVRLFDDSRLGQVWGALAHFTSPWNVVGFPAISLPIPGVEHPAPIGLQLIGKPGSDHQLLSIAHEVETVFVQSSV